MKRVTGCAAVLLLAVTLVAWRETDDTNQAMAYSMTIMMRARAVFAQETKRKDVQDFRALARICKKFTEVQEGERLPDWFEVGRCTGAIGAYAEVFGRDVRNIDIPSEVQLGTIVQIVIEYMDEVPRSLHSPPGPVVFRALREAYPAKPPDEE